MKQDKVLQVCYEDQTVGTLAMTADHKVAFQYSDEWLETGFSINPFSLPLQKQVFVPVKDHFEGLFGVFADSLPDHWGRLLLDRLLRAHKQNPDELTVLDRLAIVGTSGMGALTYHPEKNFPEEQSSADLDKLAEECQKILNTEYSDKLDELYLLGGTSGGARPKIMTTIDNEEWIIKLFPSEKCKGYFGTKRFDRRNCLKGKKKVHMLTTAAILELDFEQPSLDYHGLMKLTKIMTRNCDEDVENMFRRMCFNVFAHNRDDHSKNFTYLYEADEDKWHLSPAYDLTYSNTYYGEHTTSVDGNGRNPGRKELLAVGTGAGMKKTRCEEIIDEIEKKVKEMLEEYLLGK